MNERTAAKITAERQRQRARYGDRQFADMAPERILAVLMEEVGEVAEALLGQSDRPHPHARTRSRAELEAEIVQVAAVAAAWLDECFPA